MLKLKVTPPSAQVLTAHAEVKHQRVRLIVTVEADDVTPENTQSHLSHKISTAEGLKWKFSA